MQLTGFLGFTAVIVAFVLIGVCPTIFAVLSSSARTVQRNVLRYRRALANDGWKLLPVPAVDYMMVCSMSSHLSVMISFSRVTVVPFCVRNSASLAASHGRFSVGPLRDHHGGPLLRSTRYSANRSTRRGRTDDSRMHLPLPRGWLLNTLTYN
jgi:hypothetical protein